ncbi:MAG: photosynthetic complex putative assembly protein PuhB [Woeseiaceae bacterium]
MSEGKGDMTLGIPRGLPKGERPLWKGGPDPSRLARSALHTRKLAIYFVGLLIWRLIIVWRDGFSADIALNVALTTALLAFVVLAIARLYSAVSARSTTYTITTKRVVIRTGIALPISINVPFEQIVSVDVRRDGEGGDIELTLADDAKVGYLILWPSAKPLYFSKTRPMLRALRSMNVPASVLGEALAASTDSSDIEIPLATNTSEAVSREHTSTWQTAPTS